MPRPAAFADDNLTRFAAAWYAGLDMHLPASELHPFLAGEGLELVFPERTMRSLDEFDDWLDGIYRTFFDETHNLQSATVSSEGESSVDLDIVVGWQASWFTPPEPKSRRTSMNAIQRWTVRPNDAGPHGLQLVTYAVDRFDYAPGFATL